MQIYDNIIEIYRDYMGSGMIGALVFVSVFYIFWGETRKNIRQVLALLPCVVVVLFSFPVFVWLAQRFLGNEIYYRILWLVPSVILIAYAFTRLLLRLHGIRRFIGFLGTCGILMFCGDYVYDNAYFTVAENKYHVPDTVVEICDELVVEGREVKAVFPAELVQYVRQYTPYICMPYGREMIVERWQTYNEMYEVFELGLPTGITDAELLAKTARKYGVHYIVWDENKKMDGDLKEQKFKFLKQVDGYKIYLDEQAYLGL